MKHRRWKEVPSFRLEGYDYSRIGLYFVTICTDDRNCLFGIIKNGEINLNTGGNVVNDCWMEIPNHFPNTRLHSYVIMPNHLHGIVEITNNTIPPINEMETAKVAAKNFSPLPHITPP